MTVALDPETEIVVTLGSKEGSPTWPRRSPRRDFILGFGEYGEGFVRFALIEKRWRIDQAVRHIKTSFGCSAPARARAAV